MLLYSLRRAAVRPRVSAASVPSPLSPSLARAFAAAPEPLPDHYATLGVRRDASLDDVKRAFREQAKLHHPDVQVAVAEADAGAFKRINEAYSVLANVEKRREYDLSLRGVFGGGSGSAGPARGQTLRERNEGIYGGAAPPRGPSSVYAAGAGMWTAGKGAGGAGASANSSGSSSSGASDGRFGSSSGSWDGHTSSTSGGGSSGSVHEGPFTAEDHAEAWRVAMHRASERSKEGARMRATLARMQRPKLSVPQPGRMWSAAALPAAAIGIWAINYWLFFT